MYMVDKDVGETCTVDATSFAWMRVLKLREAFAFDKHCRVMGFALPRF